MVWTLSKYYEVTTEISERTDASEYVKDGAVPADQFDADPTEIAVPKVGTAPWVITSIPSFPTDAVVALPTSVTFGIDVELTVKDGAVPADHAEIDETDPVCNDIDAESINLSCDCPETSWLPYKLNVNVFEVLLTPILELNHSLQFFQKVTSPELSKNFDMFHPLHVIIIFWI